MKRKTLALTIVSSCALIFSSCGGKAPVKKYNIIFQNDDGEVLQESQVKKGELPVYEGADPTKTSTAQYDYEWNGWDPEIEVATQDQTYTATYEAHVRSYTIRFVDEDGTELDSQVLEYGAEPIYQGAAPTKAATAQYSYSFAGWNPEISSVVGDQTYTATYQSAVRSYQIKFLNGDGTVLDQAEVAYGQTPATALTPTKESTVDKDFTFDHWDPEITAVTGEATYTPVFRETARPYTITFQYDDGTVIESVDVAYGTVPQCSFTPEKESTAQYSYAFSGWDPTPVAVTGEATYTAQFIPTVREYHITFLNGDGSVMEEADVAYGEVPAFHNTPTKEETAEFYYVFAHWDPEVVAVTGEATYTPVFVEHKQEYTITFLDGDGSVLESQTLEYGKFPACSAEPTKTDAYHTYTFNGWEPAIAEVTGDQTYTPKFDSAIIPLDVNAPYDFTQFKYGATEFKDGNDEVAWGMPAAEAHVMKYKVWQTSTFELRLPLIDYSQHPDVSMAFEGTNYHGRVTLGLAANDVTHKDGVEENRDIVGTLMLSYSDGRIVEQLVFGTITINNVITDQDIIHGRKSVSIYVGALYDRFFNVYDITFGTENFVTPTFDLTNNYAGAYVRIDGGDPTTFELSLTRTVGEVEYKSDANQLMYAVHDRSYFQLALPKVNFALFKSLSMDIFAPGWNSGANVGLSESAVSYTSGSGDSDVRGNLTFIYENGKLMGIFDFGTCYFVEDVTNQDVILGNANPSIWCKALWNRQIIVSNLTVDPTLEIGEIKHDWTLDKMGAAMYKDGSDVTWAFGTYTTSSVLGYKVWDTSMFKFALPKINYSLTSKVTFEFHSTAWQAGVKFGLDEDDVNYSTSKGAVDGNIDDLDGELVVVNNGSSLAVTLTLGDTSVNINVTDSNIRNGSASLNMFVKALYDRNLMLNHIYLQF